MSEARIVRMAAHPHAPERPAGTGEDGREHAMDAPDHSGRPATGPGPAAVSVSQCQVLELPKIADPRGNLTFIEGCAHVPFAIERVYYLYDVPGGAERGGHAHKALHQLIIAMSGSFDVVLDDGCSQKRFHLNRSYYGLYVCPMIWRELDNFSSGSVCLVLASNKYDEGDYYRNYRDYMEARRVE